MFLIFICGDNLKLTRENLDKIIIGNSSFVSSLIEKTLEKNKFKLMTPNLVEAYDKMDIEIESETALQIFEKFALSNFTILLSVFISLKEAK